MRKKIRIHISISRRNFKCSCLFWMNASLGNLTSGGSVDTISARETFSAKKGRFQRQRVMRNYLINIYVTIHFQDEENRKQNW